MPEAVEHAVFGTFTCPNCPLLHGGILCTDGSTADFKSKSAGQHCAREMYIAGYVDAVDYAELAVEINKSALVDISNDPIQFWPSEITDISQMLHSSSKILVKFFMPNLPKESLPLDEAVVADLVAARVKRTAGMLS